MAFEQKANSGTLFANTQKKSETHPDHRGSVFVDKVLLENLINKSKGQLVEISLAAWNKTSAKGLDYLSLAASEPYVKPQEKMPYE